MGLLDRVGDVLGGLVNTAVNEDQEIAESQARHDDNWFGRLCSWTPQGAAVMRVMDIASGASNEKLGVGPVAKPSDHPRSGHR